MSGQRFGEVFNERSKKALSSLVRRPLEDTPERNSFIESGEGRYSVVVFSHWNSSGCCNAGKPATALNRYCCAIRNIHDGCCQVNGWWNPSGPVARSPDAEPSNTSA
jgi:hypothetical protein